MATGINTYTVGYELKSMKNITKNDIINLCVLLNNDDDYINKCTFTPEGITEGGILYNFNNNYGWYKTMRIYFNKDGKWDWIGEDVMTSWLKSDDILLSKNIIITTFLKSFNNAPKFTMHELQKWENYFKCIGFKVVGKYPKKKLL